MIVQFCWTPFHRLQWREENTNERMVARRFDQPKSEWQPIDTSAAYDRFVVICTDNVCKYQYDQLKEEYFQSTTTIFDGYLSFLPCWLWIVLNRWIRKQLSPVEKATDEVNRSIDEQWNIVWEENVGYQPRPDTVSTWIRDTIRQRIIEICTSDEHVQQNDERSKHIFPFLSLAHRTTEWSMSFD